MNFKIIKDLKNFTIDEDQLLDLEGNRCIQYLTDPIYVSTNQLAELFECTPQRINQYVTFEGLPKVERDTFEIHDAINWRRVKFIAELFNKSPKEMSSWGTIDFSLASRGRGLFAVLNGLLNELAINISKKYKKPIKEVQKFVSETVTKIANKQRKK